MPPREPRTRGGGPSSAVAPPATTTTTAAPEELPPNKRDLTVFEFPSAKMRLAEAVPLGDPNPMRLHVKGNLRGIVYSAHNEKRMRDGVLKAASRGSKVATSGVAGGQDHLSKGGEGEKTAKSDETAPAARVSAKVAVSAAKRPTQKRPREL